MIDLLSTTRARAIAAVVVLALVVAAVAVALKSRDGDAGQDNIAFVSAAATDKVMRQASDTAERIFTIRPDRVAATQRQAEAALVGDGISQYDKLYGPYLRRAHSQHLTLRTTVRTIGVIWQRSSTAELLVFADQAATTSAGQKASGPAQLVLRMQRSGDDWKVAGIRVL
jgi:Mce-associated membrane protein